MTGFWVVLFWISAGIIVYSYIGFSVLLIVVGKLLNKTVRKAPATPTISLIIAAYNEEDGIAAKLENSLTLDYPSDLLEIIVVSDGSDDSTAEIVASFENRGVKFLNLPRRGKIFALRDAVAQSTGQVLVFSDANTEYHPQSLRKLAENFADPQVGGVCGNQLHKKHRTADNASQGESLYWGYDKWLKACETQTGSIVSADGAIYAIRRELFEMPASTAVTDDFAISTAVIDKGYRLVFDAEALAFEDPMPDAGREFSRKVRIMNRGLRGVLMRKSLLNPFKSGFYAVVLFSHKLLRRMVPFFLIVLFIASLALTGTSLFFTVAAIAQTVFYGWALLGFLLRRTAIAKVKILYIPFFFCLANAAALVAFINLLSGKKIERWNPQRKTSAGLKTEG